MPTPITTDRDVILAVHKACEMATSGGIDDFYATDIQDGICRAFEVTMRREINAYGGSTRRSYGRGEVSVTFTWDPKLQDWVESP